MGGTMMINKKRNLILLVIFTVLFTGLIGCSSTSSDPITDATKYFASISRIERQEPQSLGLSQEQAEELIKIINPVVAGMPLTADLAEEMLKDTKKLLTDDQNKKIDDTLSSLGTPGEGTPGSGMGPGSGGGPGNGGGIPGSGEAGGSNMFIRLDETITTNYLED